jgi:hypothetical protein
MDRRERFARGECAGTYGGGPVGAPHAHGGRRGQGDDDGQQARLRRQLHPEVVGEGAHAHEHQHHAGGLLQVRHERQRARHQRVLHQRAPLPPAVRCCRLTTAVAECGKPACSDAKSCRIVTWEIALEAVSRRPPIPLCTIVARTEGYTCAANVWDLSLVQGPFSVAPCETLALRFAFFPSLYVPQRAPPKLSSHRGVRPLTQGEVGWREREHCISRTLHQVARARTDERSPSRPKSVAAATTNTSPRSATPKRAGTLSMAKTKSVSSTAT